MRPIRQILPPNNTNRKKERKQTAIRKCDDPQIREIISPSPWRQTTLGLYT